MNLPEVSNLLSHKVSLGINRYLGIKIIDISRLNDFIEKELPLIRQNHLKELPPGFEFSRKLYRQFRIDPTKSRPSSEALWRRLKNRDDFPEVNHFVNLTNLLSLKYQVCFGLYDMDKITGDIRIETGQPDDRFQGIRKDVLNMEGKIVVKDHDGAFGNPSADSLRSSVEDTTSRILQILFFHPADPDIAEITRRSFDSFKEYFRIEDSVSSLL
jgi:DNA/RNA-binding domain of Phe-tRNA-synthetase-like protein